MKKKELNVSSYVTNLPDHFMESFESTLVSKQNCVKIKDIPISIKDILIGFLLEFPSYSLT